MRMGFAAEVIIDSHSGYVVAPRVVGVLVEF